MLKDRAEAGVKLSKKLLHYRSKNAIVLAIPRGGVVVGYEISKSLNVPLDIIVPRKIGAPGQPELAIGAITEDGYEVFDEKLLRMLQVSKSYIEQRKKTEIMEIKRRMESYRKNRPKPDLKGKIVLLVDDGVATSSTIKAAINSVRIQGVSKVVVAVPVIPKKVLNALRTDVDEIVWLDTPEPFYAISQFYRIFDQTSDDVVQTLLESAMRLSA
jgi:predicted phosphoribosyltransferase